MRPSCIQVLVSFVFLILIPVHHSTAQTASNAGTSPAAKSAEQVYKNVQALKGVPADQLIPAMQFITASLGVQCDFCHVENAFEKDDKQPKQTARKMIQMMLALNKESFQGQQKITCYACHRGARKPVTVPLINDENRNLSESESPTRGPGETPSLERVLEHYRMATFAAAAAPVSTRIQHGSLSVGTKSFPVDLLSEAPDKRLTIVHFPDGDHVTAVNEKGGWSSTPSHPAHSMSMAELQEARLETEILFAANLGSIFGDLKLLGTDRVNGKEMFLVSGNRTNSPPVQLYFDAESGLLQRMVYYTETPLGTNPTQIDYGDYREQDGLRTPFEWTVSRPTRHFTMRMDKTQQNISIDDSRLRTKPSNVSQ